ncbi:MAG: ABC transporter permease [Bacillota bacterium]|nr:ABC transporter permease [Bacillota bacterium]
MTFRDIAVKNLKSHIRKYLAYFLCSSFSVMVIFMFSTLIFNKQLTDFCKMINVSFITYFSLVAVIIFAIFFINYAHTTFIRSRYKEFALYMTLGMTKKDINRIILVENSLILIFSMLIGFISGVLFSRLFQMILMKLINLKKVDFAFDFRSFLITFLTFTLIYVTVIILSRLSTRKLEISELLKHSRKIKSEKSSIIIGITGIAIIIVSSITLLFIANNRDLNNMLTFMSYFIIAFTGVYLTISNFGPLAVKIIKRRKGLYYKNLLSINEIDSKFSQNKKILLVLCVLSSIIIFSVASPFALYQQSHNIALNTSPSHIEYASVAGVNEINRNDLDTILKNSDTMFTGEKSIEFLKLDYKGGGDKYDLLGIKPVVSASTYNSFLDKQLVVPEGKAVNIITAWEPGYHGLPSGSRIEFVSGNKSFTYEIQTSSKGTFIADGNVFPSSSGIILNDKDYERIKAASASDVIGSFKVFMFEDWKKTGNVIENLKKVFTGSNSKLSNPVAANMFKLSSTLDTYGNLKKVYSVMLFIFSFMGLLFIITSGSVLYFKQYTELAETKAKFGKLYKIGIQKKEIKTIISRELLMTFFSPLVFGAIVGYSAMYLMTFMVGGSFILAPFMEFASLAIIAYFLFQVVFYLITRKKYVREITG